MELPQVISEVAALRINEEVASQLHSGVISITNDHQDHILELEDTLAGVVQMNHSLRKDIVWMKSELEEVRMQSVMCHTLLMHYMNTHWSPIGNLLMQIGDLSSCGHAPPCGYCECHITDGSVVSEGEVGSQYPSSLPSLESVSSSSIDSVYHTPTFLYSVQGLVSLTPPEVIPFIV